MDLSHRFSVPTPVEETWAHFQDIASVAECFPGAQVTSAEGDSFSGSVKVKLGPIALVYNGSGTFVEKDEAAHRFVVDAKGKDKRGNGTAGATVTLSMGSSASGGTDVEVLTDLAITGKPAQFGRGVMQDVSDKLLGQFVACLEQRLAAPGSAAAPVPGESVVDSAPPASPVAGATEDPGVGPGPAADPVPDPVPDPAPDPVPDPASAPASAPAEPVVAPIAPPVVPPVAPSTASARGGDAINLGSTVLPVLARTYWKQGLGLLVLIVLVVVLLVAL
ncbi:SRPBCC family protein [Nocardioides halotolerans]|uniref:SRPBCC family protein n=1 Tax=Nocardioides halotolerans TaxID=433660 RepID=UPI000410DF0B|nr:SRPBCC family protein [Nocardioides halotolerans]